jgi:hypothetical protein
MEIPPPPPSPPKLKAYLNELIKAVKTVQPIAGRNVTIGEEKGKGTTINATDCPPC